MKRVLLCILLFTAIATPIRGQDLNMSVSEYMQMDEVDQNAFSSFLIGIVLSSVDPQLELVRDCVGKWVRESPTHWLSSLTDWMSTAAGMANLGLVDPESPNLEAGQVLIEAIPSTCVSP